MTGEVRQTLICSLVVAAASLAVVNPAPSQDRIDPSGIAGAMILCGGAEPPAAARIKFLALAGGEKAKLVIVIPAREKSDEPITNSKRVEGELAKWKIPAGATARLIVLDSGEEAGQGAVLRPLRDATAVWLADGTWPRHSTINSGVEQEIQKLIARGGVAGGTGGGALALAALVPDAKVETDFQEKGKKERLWEAMQAPGPVPRWGIGVDKDAALLIHHRHLEVLGNATVTILLNAAVQPSGQKRREIVLKPEDFQDLTLLRRAAQSRAKPLGSDTTRETRLEHHGSLVLVGGGGISSEVVKRFIELAGGADAPIVVLPTGNPPDDPPRPSREAKMLEKAGARQVVVLSQRTLAEVESPQWKAALQQAKGVWFGGGRQWRFIDCYEGTAAQTAIHDVLRRGGVIGGSSAGATIQGEYLCRGSPLGNQAMQAEGYERGFGYLPGTAIDQHFSQRKRWGDMTELMRRHPQLLGIGIDEQTALIVQGNTAEVLGKNQVYFYDYRAPPADPQHDFILAKPGEKFDLLRRRLVEKPPAAGKEQ